MWNAHGENLFFGDESETGLSEPLPIPTPEPYLSPGILPVLHAVEGRAVSWPIQDILVNVTGGAPPYRLTDPSSEDGQVSVVPVAGHHVLEFIPNRSGMAHIDLVIRDSRIKNRAAQLSVDVTPALHSIGIAELEADATAGAAWPVAELTALASGGIPPYRIISFTQPEDFPGSLYIRPGMETPLAVFQPLSGTAEAGTAHQFSLKIADSMGYEIDAQAIVHITAPAP